MINIYIIFVSMFIVSLFAVDTKSDIHLQSIDVQNRLGEQVSSDITFVDSYSQKVSLGKYFNQNIPVVLVMAYYQCPMLCSLVLNGLSSALSEINLIPGKDYSLLTLSIDPSEGPALSKEKKTNYINSYFSDYNYDFWTFGTMTEKQITRVTDELGFNYSYDESINQYAHPAVVYVLNEEGVISSQIFGINPTGNDLKLAILNAQDGSVSSIFDKILLYCYQYNPKAGNYTLLASNVMKIAGVMMVLFMVVSLSFFWFKERIV